MNIRASIAFAVLGLVAGAGCGAAHPKSAPASTATTRDPRIPAGATLVEPGIWASDGTLYGADCARINELRSTVGGPYGPFRSPDSSVVRNGYASVCFTG